MGIVCLLLTSFARRWWAKLCVLSSWPFSSTHFRPSCGAKRFPAGFRSRLGATRWHGVPAAETGFLTSGGLYRLGNLALCAMTLAVGVLILVTLLRHKARPHDGEHAR